MSLRPVLAFFSLGFFFGCAGAALLVWWLTIPLGDALVVTRGWQTTAGIQAAFGLSCACMFALAALGPRISGARGSRLSWAWTYLAIGIATSAGAAIILREIRAQASGLLLPYATLHISTLPILEIAFVGVAAVIGAVLIHRLWRIGLSGNSTPRTSTA